MTHRRSVGVLAALVLLAGCASLPTGFDQPPGRSWPSPEKTFLGGFFGDFYPDDSDLSGVYLLHDPREAFRARYGFAAVAEHTLDIQYYLWQGDITGSLLMEQALAAADRGVTVRFLIDDIFHSGRDKAYAAIDSHPNVEVRVFNPMGNRRGVGKGGNFVANKRKLNHRMHNKIFLVDNAVAVLGGRNIGDEYFGMGPDFNFRDLDVLVVGPAAQQAGAAYDLYWNSPWAVPITALKTKPVEDDALELMRARAGDEIEALEAVPFPVPRNQEELRAVLDDLANELVWADAEVIVDPLDRFSGGAESVFVHLGKRLSEEIEQEIVAQTAYLIPTDEGIQHLADLHERGVRIRFLTNSLRSNNHMPVHAHYRKYRKRLIEAGVELHELRSDAGVVDHYDLVKDRAIDSHTGLHTKAFVFDRRLSLIGSYNMDPRSRIWNSEIGLLIDSEVFAARVLAEMERDFDPANSYRLTLNDKNKLRWTAEGPVGPIVWSHDPNASIWRRSLVRIVGWVPIEQEL